MSSSSGNGTVYVATNKSLAKKLLFKISMTTDTNKCLKKLNSSSPYDFYYVFLYKTPRFAEIEKYLHFKYINQNFKRDFFILSDNDLDQLHKICANFVEIKELHPTKRRV